VFDAATGEPHAGVDRGGLEGAEPLFALLGGLSPVRSATDDSREPSAREVLIVGGRHAAFACVTSSHRWLVLLVAPSSLSVALGWSLLRKVAAVAEVAT
jgi:hypothetical protein